MSIWYQLFKSMIRSLFVWYEPHEKSIPNIFNGCCAWRWSDSATQGGVSLYIETGPRKHCVKTLIIWLLSTSEVTLKNTEDWINWKLIIHQELWHVCVPLGQYDSMLGQIQYEFQHSLAWAKLVNSSHLSATYMWQWSGSVLLQVMTCRLFGTKPLPEPMLTHCHFDH